MMRVFWGPLIVVLTAGASPPRSLPVPPIPPANPPSAQSAPMPDRELRAPLDNAGGVQVSVQDFRIQRYYPGMAYSPGSRFETSEEKRPIQTPGLTVKLPLQ
jgi:hypothetical protein